jgi:hypothetical protein
MSYHGRRAPNVSEYIANLNAVPSAQDLQNSNADSFNLDEDLAMFTNTQFFDFDLGHDADLQPANYDGNGGRETQSVPADGVDLKQLDFSVQGKPWPFLCRIQCSIRVSCVARLNPTTKLSRGYLLRPLHVCTTPLQR